MVKIFHRSTIRLELLRSFTFISSIDWIESRRRSDSLKVREDRRSFLMKDTRSSFFELLGRMTMMRLFNQSHPFLFRRAGQRFLSQKLLRNYLFFPWKFSRQELRECSLERGAWWERLTQTKPKSSVTVTIIVIVVVIVFFIVIHRNCHRHC